MTERTKKRLPALFIAVFTIAAILGLYFVSTATASSDTSTDDAASQAQAADTQDTAKKDDAKADTAEGESAEAEQDKANQDKPEKTAIPVRAAAVEEGGVATYLSATANLVPESEVDILAEWEGRLAQLYVEEGDRIEKGQILAALADDDAEILVNKARVRAENARLAFERSTRLHDQELISEDNLEKISLDKEIAEQELAEAQWRLEKTRIRAPFGGVLTERAAQPGQHVRPGDNLFRIADFTPLVARIYLPEKDVLTLEEGRSVRLALKADDSVRFDGRIRRISPVVDTATGTVKVTVEAHQVPRSVRPGAFVRVDIVRESRQAALLLPREAIVRELQNAFVFVAEDGVASKRPVTLGLEEDGRVEVTSGIELGEQVVVAGQGGLKDGAAVKVIES